MSGTRVSTACENKSTIVFFGKPYYSKGIDSGIAEKNIAVSPNQMYVLGLKEM